MADASLLCTEESDHGATSLGGQDAAPVGDTGTLAERYNILHKIGEGTYGLVYKAEAVAGNSKNKPALAMKKVKLDDHDEGVPVTTLREVSLLKELKHENVVPLVEEGQPPGLELLGVLRVRREPLIGVEVGEVQVVDDYGNRNLEGLARVQLEVVDYLVDMFTGQVREGSDQVIVPAIVVIPGIVAFKLFGDVGDAAYGQIVAAVLPPWLSGAFAAMIAAAAHNA